MCGRRWPGQWFWALLLLSGCPGAPVGSADGGEETPGVRVDAGGHSLDDSGTLPSDDSGPSTPDDDAGSPDAGLHDAGFDAGPDDAGFDAGPDDAGFDGGPDDAGFDAGPDDAGFDAGPDDAGFDGGPDDAGFDAGPDDAGFDAGPLVCEPGFGDCDGDPSNGCETPLNTLSDCGECGESCALPGATGDCSAGICEIAQCEMNLGDCDGDPENGCERSLETPANCGACGVPCTFPGAYTTCEDGDCAFYDCMGGYSDCDNNTDNGCERRHSAVSGSCGSGINVGSFGGDTGCGELGVCFSHPDWGTFSFGTGWISTWYRGRVQEKSNCSAPLEHRIRLLVPHGIDYDLYVYRSCGAHVARSINGVGVDESVIIRQSDSGGNDDSFEYYVEVRYVSGSSCVPFMVFFDGRDC